jgi:hypothetical protein
MNKFISVIVVFAQVCRMRDQVDERHERQVTQGMWQLKEFDNPRNLTYTPTGYKVS